MRFFSKIFLVAALFNLTNCATNTQPARLRIVDLQGNPHPVQMRTPELNMTALAAQGNLSEEKIQSQPRKSDAAQEPVVANNKYANDFGASSSEAIKNTLQMQTDPQRAAPPAVSDADILTAGNNPKNKNQAVEYTLSKNKKTPAAAALSGTEMEVASSEISDVQKGIFVQTGSFTVLQHAKTALSQVEKFVSKGTTARIEEAQSNNKTVYRVLIGPFSNKQKAAATVAKLTKSGHKAIIVKNK